MQRVFPNRIAKHSLLFCIADAKVQRLKRLRNSLVKLLTFINSNDNLATP